MIYGDKLSWNEREIKNRLRHICVQIIYKIHTNTLRGYYEN